MEERAPLKPSGQYGSSDRLGPRLLARAKTESSVHREEGKGERERERGGGRRGPHRAGKSRKGGNRAERGDGRKKRAGRKEGGLT